MYWQHLFIHIYLIEHNIFFWCNFFMYNQICIHEEMLPKYVYFKLHDPAAHKYNSTLEYRRDLVKRQITLWKNNIKTTLILTK